MQRVNRATARFVSISITAAALVLASFSPVFAEGGGALYENHCSACHGKEGKGNGPMAASMGAKPPDFTDPKFWQGNAEKKIADAVKNGHGAMPPVSMREDDVKAVIAYMSQTFKK